MTLGTPLIDTTPQQKPAIHRHKRDRRTRRIAFGLTGVLGLTWALVIAGRYAGLVTG